MLFENMASIAVLTSVRDIYPSTEWCCSPNQAGLSGRLIYLALVRWSGFETAEGRSQRPGLVITKII